MTAATDLLFLATLVCVAVNVFEVGAKIKGARFVLNNSSELGIGRRWIPYLAAIEGAGTAGMVIGLVWLPILGLTAAAGLVGFFIIAVAAHAGKKVLHNIAFPITFLLLACAAVGYFARVGVLGLA